MMNKTMIGVDLAKAVFQVHGASMTGEPMFRKKLSRQNFSQFMAKQPPTLVVMEACGSAHHWAREMTRLGHEVKLIAPRYVKPFVKRQKNDAADAEAIVIAARQPEMRFVEPKGAEQQAERFCFALANGSSTSVPNSSTHLGLPFTNTAMSCRKACVRSDGLRRSLRRHTVTCLI
jgi:hypothetical protein